MASKTTSLFPKGMLFGPDFLRDHAGQIMSDPRVAIVELVANAYDAGASRVSVVWPEVTGESFSIEDNGTGMTAEEFGKRWRTLGYKRVQEQGSAVVFPKGTKGQRRTAFGQSGKGRHGAFCFAEEYIIETRRDGEVTAFRVSIGEVESEPFSFEPLNCPKRTGHGTKISATVNRNLVSIDDLAKVIGSKFLVDPAFSISLNGKTLALVDLGSTQEQILTVPGVGEIKVLHIDPRGSDRTMHLRGITWWVNRRMVGTPSWNGLEEQGAILDGRTAEAKRFSFVVAADPLHEHVKQDWSGFHGSDAVNQVQHAVREHVIQSLDASLASNRRHKKITALKEAREALGGLSNVSQRAVGQFADNLLSTCPTLSQGDLNRTLALFANMEKARTGYDLLAELSICSPDDIDRWTGILKRWSASDAEAVLGELQWRLEMLAKLQTLIARAKADEVHELQPLFERGLWIFGPEFESVEFRSNRSLATVVKEMLGGTTHRLSGDRPDFVALPDRSIGIYAADSFDVGNEVNGISKVLVIELKHGGSTVEWAEVSQPEKYVTALRKGNHVQLSTRFQVFVLGTTLGEAASDTRRLGENENYHTIITPMKYETIIQRAHARTFNLLRKVKGVLGTTSGDPEVESVIAEVKQPLFEPEK